MKKIDRLVAFGCSFTYGQGLPDCIIGNNYSKFSVNPSSLSWPNVLGKLLNIPVVNKGIPGASNIEILYHIINFEFKPNDFVIVMWSLPNRDAYFISTSKKFKPFRQLGVWLKSNSAYISEWLKNIQPVDNGVKSWLHIHHANLYLKSLNLSYIHYPAIPSELGMYKPKYIGSIDNFYTEGMSVIDGCKNDNHPGPKSQKETANRIYKIIKSLDIEVDLK